MLHLDEPSCFEAVRRKEARFDGRFYFGVTSTQIFCRPSCPARTPKKSNLRFFAHPASAIEQGYRACRRCRPELAPGNPEWRRRQDLAGQAITAIERGDAERVGIAGLARQLGVSSRHLRRELKAAIGSTPQQLLSTRRLWLAQLLLEQTDLPITEVVFAAGFGSVRRFNEVFQAAFARTPSDFRAQFQTAAGLTQGSTATPSAANSAAARLRFDILLPSRGPLGWDRLLAFFERRCLPGLELVNDGSYTRWFPGGWLELTGSEDDRSLRVRCEVPNTEALAPLLIKVRQLTDLDSDTSQVAESFHNDPLLGPLLYDGVPALPGAFNSFEIAVRAVVGQQISVNGAQTILARIVARTIGNTPDESMVTSPVPGGAYCHFPTPSELLAADLEAVGLTSSRCQVLRNLARAVETEEVNLGPNANSEETQQQLQAIPGIGPWTAGYVAMRALADPNAWPENDLVIRNTLGLSGAELLKAAQKWRPWRAYASLLVWSTAKDTSQ